MKFISNIALAAVAVVALTSGAQAGSKCVMAGGEATMVTEDLAKFMAGAALKNSMAAHGWTAHGAVKMKCDSTGLPHCVAHQKACG